MKKSENSERSAMIGMIFAFILIGRGISWAKEYGETYLSFAYRNAHTN